MSYIFPKRRLRDNDVLDPVELNQDIVPAAENYSGRLNAHNFQTGTQFAVGEEARYKHHYVHIGIDPDFGDPGSGYQYGPRLSGATKLEVQGEWTRVGTTYFTAETGSATLWIIGHVAYSYSDPAVATYHMVDSHTDDETPNVQFALRIDGQIIEATSTSTEDIYDQTFEPAQLTFVASKGINAYAHKTEPAGLLGRSLYTVRIGTLIPVAPGSHTVELVVRQKLPEAATTAAVYLFTRTLYALETQTNPGTSLSASTVDVGTFASEDSFSAAAVGTNRVDKVRTAYNNVEAGSLARGSLNHKHITSNGEATIKMSQASLVSGHPIYTRYPGFGVNTIAGANTAGTTGWYPLKDSGLSSELKITDTFDLTTKPSFTIVLANVAGKSVYDSGGAHGNVRRYGSYSIGVTKGGTVEMYGAAETYVHQMQGWAQASPITGFTGTTGNRPENIDVPLFMCLDHRSTPTLLDASAFGVYGSVMATADLRITHGRGNIIVIQFYY